MDTEPIKQTEEIELKYACAIIYERKELSDEDYTMVYQYVPVEVLSGEIVGDDLNNRVFSSKYVKQLKGAEKNEETGSYQFPLMSDSSCLREKYVYGFPIYMEDPEDKKTIAGIKKELNTLINDTKDFVLMQAVNKDDYFDRIFLISHNYKVSINPEDYDDFFDLVYGMSVDKIDEVLGTYQPQTQVTNEPTGKVKPEDYLYADELYDAVSKTVICQDEQIRAIVTQIAKNSRLSNPDLKSSILVCGPTGVGKTKIFQTLKEKKIIPVTIEDANEYSAVSLKGKDSVEMLAHLIKNADGDIERAQRGILVVDEVDKKVSTGSESETYTTAVIDALLKMMEGHVYSVPMERDIEVQFDTSQLTFVLLGAFSGIEKLSNMSSNIGFRTNADEKPKTEDLYNDATLKKYGLKPEFIGRSSIVPMKALDIEDFIKIIKTSDKSQLLLYKYLLSDIGIDFIYDDKTIEAIATKAKALGVGARSIKKIVETALAVANFQVFSRNNYKELIISPETLEDNHSFILR